MLKPAVGSRDRRLSNYWTPTRPRRTLSVDARLVHADFFAGGVDGKFVPHRESIRRTAHR
jgi:hypothetical protein